MTKAIAYTAAAVTSQTRRHGAERRGGLYVGKIQYAAI